MKNHFVYFLTLVSMLALMNASASSSIVSTQGIGEQKVLVILLKFPDVKPSFSKEQVTEKYFDKLDRYLQAISYNKTWIKGKITEWYTLPREAGSYRISQHNLEVEKDRVNQLIQDAVDLVDEDEDLSQYSMIFLSLGARREEYGMMGLCGYPGMLGWQSQFKIKTKGKGQEIPNGVAIYCENAHVGVVFHDMAHIMGGVQNGKRVLPCLYDHTLQAQRGTFRGNYQFYLINVGFYDPMSCHYYELEAGPPGVCAWTKMRLHWIEPEKITAVDRGENKTVLLGPLSSSRSAVQAITVPITSSTYYVIENRQPLGPDVNLPSHGVCIYFCDDRIAECLKSQSPIKLINANPAIDELRGAPFSVVGNDIYQDTQHNITIKCIGQNQGVYRISVSNNK